MRVLVGAALVVGTMADGHCDTADGDCAACATDFTACGGSALINGEQWDAYAAALDYTKTDDNCVKLVKDVILVAGAEAGAEACVLVGGTWAAAQDAVAASCTAAGFTFNETDGFDNAGACAALTATAATCTNDTVTAGTACADANDCDATDVDTCQQAVTNDDAVTVAFTASSGPANGNCVTDAGASTVTVEIACTTACTGDGTGTADGNEDGVDCNHANHASNTWTATGTCATTTGSAAAVDASTTDTAAECNARASAATTWTPVFNAAVAGVYNAGSDAAAAACNGATWEAGATWSTDCNVTKGMACVAHLDLPANEDCTAADSTEGSASAADPSDSSPASMLQVGAAVLASLAMLL